MVRDPSTGKYKRVRLFVLTLGYSRKCALRAGGEIHQIGHPVEHVRCGRHIDEAVTRG